MPPRSGRPSRRYRYQFNHLRRPLRPAPHREGAGHGDQADPQGDRPDAVRGERVAEQQRGAGPEQQHE